MALCDSSLRKYKPLNVKTQVSLLREPCVWVQEGYVFLHLVETEVQSGLSLAMALWRFYFWGGWTLDVFPQTQE